MTSDGRYRLFKRLSEISPAAVSATLVHEDQYFFWHFGINPWSLIQGFRSTYVTQNVRRGGSTITMQLARMVYGMNSRSISGKLKQILAATWIELIYTKDDILEAYLNLAPYGGNIEGIPAAALLYFNKTAKDLNVLEAMTLAIIPQSPSRRALALSSGGEDSKRVAMAKDRLKSRWHSKNNLPDELKHIPWPALKRQSEPPFNAPHFVDDVLARNYSQLNIHSTLDLSLQETVERILASYIDRRQDEGIKNGSIAILHYPSMELRALVGSADFFNDKISGQVNAAKAFRSPGSTLKPFIYGLAMDQGLIHPRSLLKDTPVSYAGFDPENSDNDFIGPISVIDALNKSRNIPAIDTASKLREGGLFSFLKKAGVAKLRNAEFYGLAIALGGAEVTMENLLEMYAMLGNHGEFKKIRRIQEDPQITTGQLLTPESAFMVLNILKRNPRPDDSWATVASERDRIPAYWKTGTSYSFRDAWTLGLVGPYVIAVWIGNFDNTPNPMFIGREAAAPLFFQLTNALALRSEVIRDKNRLEIPASKARQVEVCALSGDMPGQHCSQKVMTWYVPTVSPIKTCDMHREIYVDPKTGLRACGPDEGAIREIAEFWPSDLLRVLRLSGVNRKFPPPYDPRCGISDRDGRGSPPHIRSPRDEVIYEIDMNKRTPDPIAFQADSDASARRVYWYIGKSILGSSLPSEPFYWTPTPGRFTVRAVDDLGRSSQKEIRVEALNYF